ncbi:hypothetical protein CF319_g6439 [Tilletia indica]|uniref:Uncharacterized protein n=1 Tax=Tilletia indica TaxID=43049 RepID=A0A177TJ22_9BASI|nr:hypothetical protein CF319_g6439 [Tilletia indica]KAE8220220.1 hypothetical protein CF326_g8795 [Tilletia indica]KAE8241078.1 hypothetical protein A4X13_0g7571 [Tilletia indica]
MVYDPDPFARAGGPPRHSIESDSEDDDLDLNLSSTKQKEAQPTISFRPTGPASSLGGRPLLVVLPPTLTSGPGASSDAALAGALGPLAQLECRGTFDLGSETQASLGSVGKEGDVDVLVLSPDAEGASHPTSSLIAREIVRQLKPSRIALLTTYWPPTYIISPDLDPPTSDEPPVRFLSSDSAATAAIEQAANAYSKKSGTSYEASSAVLPFDVPNALTGVDGALVLQANLNQISISVLLQPFDMLQGVGHTHSTADHIFPLFEHQDTSPLPSVVEASLGTSLSLPPQVSTRSASTLHTGDFLRSRRRSRRRKEVEEEEIRSRLAGRTEAVESTLYV